MSADKIFLEDVRFYGHHGVTPAQQEVGAWFSVDVELGFDVRPAALSDDLGSTIDYGGLAALIVSTGTRQRVNLLERLAGLLAEAVLREYPCQHVRLRVRKLTPPMGGLGGTPGVEVARHR